MHSSEDNIASQEATEEEKHIHCVGTHSDDSEPFFLYNVKCVLEINNGAVGKEEENMSQHHVTHCTYSDSI